MKIKTAELTGAALNWAVAMCEGWKYTTARDNTGQYPWLVKHGKDIDPKQYRPSSNWMQGGPIIEREGISVALERGEPWAAWSKAAFRDDAEAFGYGETPLVAAMRCHVASKMGDEIEVPEEITL
jgi:hypothetical protein